MRFALLALIILSASCNSVYDVDETWIAGFVVARDVRISSGDPPSIHVKATQEEQCGIVYLVRNSTEIRRLTSSGSFQPAAYADLVVGTRVRVKTGIVMTSCPEQAGTSAIDILP